MTKKILQFIFGSSAANIFMAVGLALLGLAIYFGVNPADGSAVNPLVRGTWIHLFLLSATIPAQMVLLFAGDGIVGFVLMFSVQLCVFWTLGRILVLLFSSLAARHTKKNGG
jgi:hypothetical protein